MAPCTAAYQVSLSSTISQSLLKFMSTELVMLSNHLILYCFLLLLPSIFPKIRIFSNESALHIRWPKYRTSASVSDLIMNIQDWFPLGLTGLISLQSEGLSKSSSTPQFKSINSSALSLLYGPSLTSVPDYWNNHSSDYRDLCWQSDVSAFTMLSRFVIAFLPRSKCLSISWL